MKPFKFEQAKTIDEASETHLRQTPNASFISGGTDILGEIKEGNIDVDTLINLSELPDMSEIIAFSKNLEIGALVTLSRIASDKSIGDHYQAMSQAAISVAIPQIRNVGTLGGNLCQRPRCWYYRSTSYRCLKKGGLECFAYAEGNKYHAIFGSNKCYIVHPSDIAVALLALDAVVCVSSATGTKDIPVSEFYVLPETNVHVETVLEPGEFISKVKIPKPVSDSKSIYVKVKERQGYDFALSSVAISVELDNGTIKKARVVLGGVAPIPYSIPHVDFELIGKSVSNLDVYSIGQLAVQGARPLSENRYKVQLTASTVARALSELFDL